MDETIKNHLKILGLKTTLQNWNPIFQDAKKKNPSYHRFLTDIIEREYNDKQEKARLARLKRANIPEIFFMETFPFSKQLRLDRKKVMELYDSMSFIKENIDLVFVGPTGCGKTGLATSYLIHAINQGYRGYFITFSDLLRQFRQCNGDYSEDKVLRRYNCWDTLLIDEVGYDIIDKEQSSLFFQLMKSRIRKHSTIITSQLGFEEWPNILKDKHLAPAIIDRITENCAIFNMKECISIRPKKIIYATKKSKK